MYMDYIYLKSKAESSYHSDSMKIDFTRHIRNAVAHARVAFIPFGSVTFTDENINGEKCAITFPLENVGVFLTELQKVFMKYIERLKIQINK